MEEALNMFTKAKSRVFFIAVYFFAMRSNLDCREGGFLFFTFMVLQRQ